MIKKKKYLLSVIMSVYNAERTIYSAVNSILTQTFSDFEFIIIDDGSIDNTVSILRAFSDKRIQLYLHSHNKGVAKTLNEALRLSQGEYIARMDADDISSANRLKVQVTYLKKHPNVGVVGTGVIYLDKDGKDINKKIYCPPSSIERAFMYSNPLIHPTIVMRKMLIEKYGNYDEYLNGAEDYDLWLRLAKNTKIEIVPEKLLRYRISSSSVSYKHIKRVQKAFLNAQIKSIRKYGYPMWRSLFIIKSLIMWLLPIGTTWWVYKKLYEYN